MTTFWYAPGMMYPYWVVRGAGNEAIAHNADADTDMGDLFGDEFWKLFPYAFQISEEEYVNRSITKEIALNKVTEMFQQKAARR